MTHGEIAERTRNSKHETIGRVELVFCKDKTRNHVKVIYKSGRKYEYTRGNIPQTVMDFLHKQNMHFKYVFPNGVVVCYFMT